MAKKPTRGARQPSGATESPLEHITGSGSAPLDQTNGFSGSGPGLPSPHCKFFPKGQPLPVELTLKLDAPIEGGLEFGF
jgi:hypothetical protein